MIPVILGLIGLAGNAITVTAFTLVGRAHAKERQFLLNAALSGSAYEFAVRQEASVTKPPANSEVDDDYSMIPEGL